MQMCRSNNTARLMNHEKKYIHDKNNINSTSNKPLMHLVKWIKNKKRYFFSKLTTVNY